MTTETIDPKAAERLIAQGRAVLVDIREPFEHARESIEGARLVPLTRLATHDFAPERARHPAVIFHCQGGNRTQANASKLGACGFSKTYMLKGGIDGWKQAGLPANLDRSKPIALQRQVQIAAGGLILLGFALALTVSPWFAGLAAFVGAGLLFAGISGWCGMAKLLAVMPWNRAAA
jgi:rhodanese-related sulfurtransferase